MSKKISHSSWNKYHICPKMWEYHYMDRLRPQGMGSPLIFGIAMDEALNALLLKTGDPVKVFQENFKFEDTTNVAWDNRDFDGDLFTEEQFSKVADSSWDYKCWASMRIKGRLLIDAYIQKIYPLIEEVIHVQKEIEGSSPGVLDAVVKLKGHGVVLLDHKTSVRPYEFNDVARSTQLALYAQREGLSKVGFAVLVKTIYKKVEKACQKCTHVWSTSHTTCPKESGGKRCRGAFKASVELDPLVQLFVDDVRPHVQRITEESITKTEKAIELGLFPRNLGSCSKIFGKPCPYQKKCWNNSNSGLIIAPERKKK